MHNNEEVRNLSAQLVDNAVLIYVGIVTVVDSKHIFKVCIAYFRILSYRFDAAN